MKIKRFLGFIALAVAVLLPMSANAAEVSIDWSPKKVQPDAEGYYTVNVTLNQSQGLTATTLEATMELGSNVEYVDGSIMGSGTWTGTVTGNSITFTSSTIVTDTQSVVGTLRFKVKDLSKGDCGVTFYCNGTTTEVAPETTPENPKTGNVLPYAVIVAGIAIAGAVYYVTRKNNKLYNI